MGVVLGHVAGELSRVVCEGAVTADAARAASAGEEMCLLNNMLVGLLACQTISLLSCSLLDLLSFREEICVSMEACVE